MQLTEKIASEYFIVKSITQQKNEAVVTDVDEFVNRTHKLYYAKSACNTAPAD